MRPFTQTNVCLIRTMLAFDVNLLAFRVFSKGVGGWGGACGPTAAPRLPFTTPMHSYMCKKQSQKKYCFNAKRKEERVV